jgi:hypothetical protein
MVPIPNTGDPVNYDIEQIIEVAGTLVVGMIGTMGQLGITTLQTHVKNFPIEVLGTQIERDVMRWFKWSVLNKSHAEREHLYPADLVSSCQWQVANAIDQLLGRVIKED